MTLLTRDMIAHDIHGSWERAETVMSNCERIAGELYPDVVESGRADIARGSMFLNCCSISEGRKIIPEWVADDQVEDWLAARAVRTVCEIDEANYLNDNDPVIRTMESEYAIHGFRTPQEAGHRFGD